MRNTIQRTVFIFTLLLASLASTFLAAQSSPGTSLDPLSEQLYQMGFGIPNSPLDAPDFTVKGIDGRNVSLSSLKGKVVLLNFWATWCPPCKAEMPDMESLYGKMKDSGFTILAISSNDGRETRKKVEDFVKDNGYTFPTAFDDSGSVVPSFYRTGSIPTSYLLNTEGKVIARLVGMYQWDTPEMNSVLKKLAAQ